MGLFGGKPKGEELKLKVDGMTCGHCVMHVQKSLEGLKGVKKATVSLGNKEAVVIYDAALVKKEDMIKAIDEAGYKAS
jgi:copper ion binding protein